MNTEYEVIIFIAEAQDHEIRVDKVISKIPEIKTRSRAEKLISLKLVTINQTPIRSSFKVKEGDRIEIKIPLEQKSDLQHFDLDLDIPYEDEDILIVNKPSGLVVHPAPGHINDTLVNALLSKNIKLSMGFNEQRPGIVHRIDKDTSGIIVIAKNNEAHSILSKQFKQKSVHRIYNAITYRPIKFDEVTYSSHLIRHPVHRKKYTIERIDDLNEPKGRLAITHCRKLKSSKYFSLVECQLETGRTHQIRVHLSHAGHPVICDPIYSSNKEIDRIKNKELKSHLGSLTGIGLHAHSLGFIHPSTKKYIEFSVGWPANLLPLIKQLGWE